MCLPMATIRYNNVVGTIETKLKPEELEYIDSKTKYRLPGYDKTWNYKRKLWDGYTHAFDFYAQRFRRGLLDRVVGALQYLKHDVVLINEAIATCATISPGIHDGIIRPYEFQAKVRGIVRQHERGIIASPTGTGKTYMAGLIIDELKLRTLVIVNELVLLDQMHRSLGRTIDGATIGYIGNTEFELGDIVIATVQSLTSILGIQAKKNAKINTNLGQLRQWLASVGLVIHDEAHLADADTCIALYGVLDTPSRVIGFSATPFGWADKQQKVANIELEQVFGRVIYSTFDQDFIGLGLKVPCVIKSVQVPARIEKYGTFRDNQGALYKKALQFEILQNDEWANTVKEQVKEFTRDNMTCFVYATHSLEYGEKLATLLGAPFVQGKTPRAKRFEIFDALQDKKIPAIVSDIGGIGLDIPSLDAFVLASDAKDIRQMRGRVERADAKSGKTVGHFVDLYKSCSFLSSHRQLRLNQYQHDNNIIY
jgi:superfamily II DNA or RNA helicase